MFDWVFLKGREQCLCSFYCPESSNCFPVKTHVFGRSFNFYIVVCKHGALHLRLHVIVLLASVTNSWPAKPTSKLNMSGLDFLVPVLQSFNSFDLNAFFQVLFSLIRIDYGGNVSLLLSGSLPSIFLCKLENLLSVLFSVWSFKRFPR